MQKKYVNVVASVELIIVREVDDDSPITEAEFETEMKRRGTWKNITNPRAVHEVIDEWSEPPIWG
jgi:hypothetical protein